MLILLYAVTLLFLCLWSSAFTDISVDQTERMCSDLVSYFRVRLWGEKAERLWHTPHDSLILFNSSRGKTLRSLLSVSLRGVCLPFHHPAFIPVFLSQHGNILASPLLFYTRFELHCIMSWCSRVSVFPLCLCLSFSLGCVHQLWMLSRSFALWEAESILLSPDMSVILVLDF